ncbi:eukaryotic translation initiation factor 3 subunit F-like [Saccoglossus kowalevskii]|uniref:Eukaryotic translation initiation factor 3 subunit F n=1 Tax=Saccoglossus kowalevskii TaxID=10224 RepID=A0ABM0GMJ4_SACKO|nr:PREDICTED: eukaryotic translation initiation factor 3 subunit F-like [Saccoglossus kowalevskii]
MALTASLRTCHVHPVVLLSIVDSYERRNEDAKRVIGTLLGTNTLGHIEVTNCFSVPHNESEDEVAVDMEFAKNMYDLHKRVNSAEMIVGWYATGSEITEHSVLIHEYYNRECNNPIHITVDTMLKDDKLSCKGWQSQSMGVPGKTKGTIFTPVPIDTIFYEPEKVAIDMFIEGKNALPNKRTIDIVTDLEHVGKNAGKLRELLTIVINYVDDVLGGKMAADNIIGRYLMDLLNTVPQIEAEQFEEMLNNNMKDLLMVVYLSNLVSTQLALSEKINMLDTRGLEK